MLRFLKTIYQRMLDPNLRWYLDTLPTGANATAATGGAAWTWGAYAQVIATTLMDLYIVGVSVTPTTVDINYEFRIARGAGGAEVVLAVLSVSAHDANTCHHYDLPYPLYIQIGQRLAVGCREDTGAGVIDIKLRVAYYI